MKDLQMTHSLFRFQIKSSTIQLLRIPYSYFLSPIYLFALSQVPEINWFNAVLIFFILHFLIFPASNGYNSYMDRDTESIGGLEKPPPPSRQLYLVTIVLDTMGILLSLIIGWLFTLVVLSYIGFSKAYSYRGIRLKKYPYLGYLFVIIFQGAITFWMVYYGSNAHGAIWVPWPGMVICSLIIGGFYPLTQIYQHKQDADDGVKTISYKLGYLGTFIFCAIVYLLLGLFIFELFITKQSDQLLMIGIFCIPAIFYFIRWFLMVSKNVTQANFTNSMRMNWVSATCANISFFILLIWRFL
ncbi:MAG TPA: UbiA family prenyltransferase [Chitinophagaceae bacterium]|nr:UbiA family prenyltransferase [Chitinophagaceae bacterium]